MSRCWICNKEADSREHKIKRSDIVRVHGKGNEFKDANLNYLTSDEKIVILQGANSKYLKFKKVLCEYCNNTKTQPFDFAYDQFITYIEDHEELILKQRYIDFSKIYGNSWPEEQLNLFRFFTKAFGCRIADAGHPVPSDFQRILFNSSFETMLYVCIAINEDELQKSKEKQNKLKIGNLITNEPNLSDRKYMASYWYKWLLVSFWYDYGPFGSVGSKWCADSQFMYVGSYNETEHIPMF